MVVKSTLEKVPAAATPFNPTPDVPASDTQAAIEYVRSVAQSDADAAVVAQYAADDGKSTAQIALATATRARQSVRHVSAVAENARNDAAIAKGIAARAETRIRKIDDVQIALKAQVFN